MRPKVIVVGPVPPPIGGVENFTVAILQSDQLQEFEIHHCDLTKGRPKQTQGKFDLGNAKWAFIHFNRLKKKISEVKPDLVYMPVTGTWSGFFRDAVLAKIVKKRKIKLIGHLHGGWFGKMLQATGWKGRIVKKTLERFDMMLLLGTPWLTQFQDYGFKGKLAIVPATTRDEIFDVGAIHKPNYDTFSHGFFLGQVGKRKGVYDILQAQSELKSEGTPHKVVYVGPGEFEGEWESVLQKKSELGLDDLTEFLGSKMGEELLNQFKSASYFIMTSYDEGLPAAILEAGAFGLPMITTPVGAVCDVLTDGADSILVEPGNVEQIKVAMKSLENPDLRKKLGETARIRVQEYRPSRVVSKIAEAIRTVLAKDS